jgi:acyl CoA:acetate/3-ketoacid CoA transferase alpha subunit
VTEFLTLSAAISRFVRPGMHLNFASTPSRSNAAVRELARQYQNERPEFELSATGFHSTLHLLARLRLGRRYRACFFGDNYPSPQPNPLYRELVREGAELEHWSLWSYVSALRAAALGHSYAVTSSLHGSALGADLARAQQFVEIDDPRRPGKRLSLLAPLSPELVFLHAPLADRAGNIGFFPPLSEGFYGALAARAGVIVTVERVLEAGAIPDSAQCLPVPSDRVLAVCQVPHGAHPQPLHVPQAASLVLPGYHDDFEHYELWRRLSLEPEPFRAFLTEVLNAPDLESAYLQFVGRDRLASQRVMVPESVLPKRALDVTSARSAPNSALSDAERLILGAARALLRRVRAAGCSSLLAGIGQSFAAARLAAVLAEAAGLPLELLVEIGMSGVDPWQAHPFLLSERTMASAKRLSSIETVLGALTCGAENRCLGVLGAAQVDEAGSLNSSYVGGELLVGSGGANDIASSAREVLVLCPAKRLTPRVDYVTSPGQRVRVIATELGVLERASADAPWSFTSELDDTRDAARLIRERTSFAFEVSRTSRQTSPPTLLELRFLDHLRSQRGESTPSAERRAS